MKIEAIKVGELMSFVKSDFYKVLKNIPITQLRAISQSKNPRAAEEDIALIIAHKNGKLLSFIGLLPDILFSDGKQEKIWWNSCWWADETVKDNGSMHIFYLACKVTNNQLYFPELTPHTTQLIKKLRQFNIMERSGVKGYLSLNTADILPARNKKFYRLKALFLAIDWAVNAIATIHKNAFNSKLKSEKTQCVIITSLDEETAKFISDFQKKEHFRRNKDELNWISSQPWISTQKQAENQKYAFSSHANSFQNQMFKVYENGEMKAFFMLLVRNGNAKLTYSYCETKNLAILMNAVYMQVLSMKACTFQTFNPPTVQYIQHHKSPFILIRKQKLIFAHPKNAGISADGIQDGDGDCAFV